MVVGGEMRLADSGKPVLADVFVFGRNADLYLCNELRKEAFRHTQQTPTLSTRSMQDFWSSDISRCLGHLQPR